METWAIDTEFGYQNGRLDCESAWRAVCLCLVEIHSGEQVAFWGRDPGLDAWFRQHGADTFIAHYAAAEIKYLLRLNIQIPDRWYDTYIAWRRVTNRPGLPEAGLAAALHQAGLPHLAPAIKRELQGRIARLAFDPDDPGECRMIVDYCFSDCAGCAALYRKLEQRIDPVTMAHWIEYVKAISRMELRGVPIDVTTARLILRRREAIREDLIDRVNRTRPIYRKGVFSRRSFWVWCYQNGISWPWTRTRPPAGPTALDDETLETMETRHPFIGQIRQVKKTLHYLGNRGIKCDGLTRKHYFNTSPFRSVTGRNQPRNFIFCGPKWLRFLIVPESDSHTLVYVDFVAQEVGIAAALSGDPAMRAMYEQADAHIAFAILAGAAPPGATKDSHPLIRKQYKTVNLGVLYGQSEFGISARLGIPQSRAQAMLVQHHDLFPDYWAWSDRVVQAAFDRGEMRTPCGWGARVPLSSNIRTWMNFPVQATGADIMRLVVTYLDRQQVDLLAPVHDGFLLSCPRDRLAELRGGGLGLWHGGGAGLAGIPVALGDGRTRGAVLR